MRTKPCLHRFSKGNTNPGPLETGTKHFGEILCGTSITPQSKGRGKRLRCAPANSPITRGRGVRKPIDRLLRPLALRAWTYATGSPTPKGLGSSSERPAALACLSRFRHPRTVRIRSTTIIGHRRYRWQLPLFGEQGLSRPSLFIRKAAGRTRAGFSTHPHPPAPPPPGGCPTHIRDSEKTAPNSNEQLGVGVKPGSCCPRTLVLHQS